MHEQVKVCVDFFFSIQFSLKSYDIITNIIKYNEIFYYVSYLSLENNSEKIIQKREIK